MMNKWSRWLTALVLIGLMPIAQGEEKPEAGHLVLNGGSGETAVHLGTQVDMTIEGLQARVVVTQQFKNQTDRWVNATYLYPLPEDSAVTTLKMVIGERTIVGEIQEKAQARTTFEKAKAAGKKATLVEQQRPNLFRQEVANVAPGETIEVRIGYSQQVIYDSGEFRVRMPMTLTPRYIPGVSRADLLAEAQLNTTAHGWAAPTDQVVDAHRITPTQHHVRAGSLLNPIAVDIALAPGMTLANVRSDTHRLKVEQNHLDYRIGFAEGQVSMDRDFELTWIPEPDSAPVAALFSDDWRGDRYVQLLLVPPREVSDTQVLPRELILIVDTSGSMAGSSIEQARSSALMALDRLTERDRFNLVLFNSDTHKLFKSAVPATAGHLNRARRTLNNMSAGGGTEMQPALESAFGHTDTETHLQQLVFVTDGSVGNESALLKLIQRKLGRARLFTVAIGGAPNRFFMRRAAEFGRGSFTEIATGGQVQERMKRLLGKLERPVVSDLAIDWPQPVEVYPRKIPDLYWGEPLVVTAQLPPWPQSDGATVKITGRSAGKSWVRELALDQGRVSHEGDGVPVLAQRFGRDKITFLENQLHTDGDTELARARILPVALDYELMSRYTSLVAVDKTPARRPDEQAIDSEVANAMPAGSAMQAVGYPQTSAGLLWHLFMGALALVGLLTLHLPGVHHGWQ